MKTRVLERIRIRDKSGQIKGPFRRAEVNDLIRAKKIDGEEEIFLESEGTWKPIASDTDFFDLIQEVLFGIKSGTQSGVRTKGAWTHSAENEVNQKIDRTERLGTERIGTLNKPELTSSTQAQGKTTFLSPEEKKAFEDEAHSFNTKVKETSKSQPAVTSQASTQIREIKSLDELKEKAPKEKKKNLLRGILVVFVFLVLILAFLPETTTNVDLKRITFQYDFKYGYFRPLQLRLRLMAPVELPPRDLQNDISAVKVLPLNLHDLMLKEEEFSRKPELKTLVSTWVYKLWTYRILGDVVSATDLKKGAELKAASNKILASLNENKLPGAEINSLIKSLDFLLDGEVGRSFAELNQLQNKTIVSEVYARELSYWATLGGDDTAESLPINYDELSELALKYQYEEELRKKTTKDSFDSNFLKTAENILAQDSHSLLSWFLLAKYYLQNPAVANRYYFTGLCMLSLWPRTLQAMYWRSYGQFLEKTGAKEASERLMISADLIEVGEFGKNKHAVDIDDTVFKYKELLNSYKKAFEENEMTPIELASFEILSGASLEARDNLVSVLISPLLDKNWNLAERRLRLVEKTFPFDNDIKTLKVWLEGERFRFERAQEILMDSFNSADGSDFLRAEGILYIIGRDYEGGIETLKKYIELSPQDAISYFFIARASFETEKYTDCVKYSQLCLLNATGPLRLRAQTMNYRCRVKAQLGSEDALREFGQFISQFPYNSISREEHIRALLDADQSQEALKIAEKMAIEHPKTSSLKALVGEVLENRGDLDAALAMYNEARKLDSKNLSAAIKIADLFYKEERFKEAASNYVSAAANDLEYPELFLKAARAYRKAGSLDEAQAMYLKEIELRPAVLETFLEAAEFLLESNRPKGVPDLFAKFNEDFRSDSRVLTRLAQAYFAMGDKKNARLNAELAVKQNPKEAEPYRILGGIFDSEGQYPLAKANYEKYLVLVPQAPEAETLKKKLSMPPY